MISVSIHDVVSAEPMLEEGSAWVTLRLADGSRVTLFLHTFDQCVAVANAINAEAQAREKPSAVLGAPPEEWRA